MLNPTNWTLSSASLRFPLLRNLLGLGGFLQYFDAIFRGADEEVVLFANAKFAGQII